MKDFIEYIIKEMLPHPDEVTVEEVVDGTLVTIKVCAKEEDMGILIGKNGRTIKSIRDLAKAKAIKDNVKVLVEVC